MRMPKQKDKVMLPIKPNRMHPGVPILTHNVNVIFKQLCIIVFTLFLAENCTFAMEQVQPDLKINFNGRTYPIGAQLVGTLGASYPIWGDTETWKYGYVRAGLNLMTSAVVNRAGIELQAFPISIAGFTAGYDTGVRNYVPKFLDCNVYECTGRVDRKYLRMNLMAAYKGFSFGFAGQYEEMRGFGTTSKPVYDETTLLLGRRDGEHTFTLTPALLYEVAEHTGVGFASLYSRAIDTGGYSHLYGPVVDLTPQPKLNMLFGAGLNSSPVAHSAFCGFFVLQYNIIPSLGVMDLALRNEEKNVGKTGKKAAFIPDASESPEQ